MISTAKIKLRPWLKIHGSSLVIFFLFLAGLTVLFKTMHGVNIHDVYSQAKALPVNNLLLAVLFTLFGYMALIGYDWSALRYIDKKLPFPLVAFTSFVGFTLSNTIGVSWLSGGAVRYRLYSRVGLGSKEIALVIAYCTIGFGIGETLVGSMALISHPEIFANYFSYSSATVRWSAVILLVSVIGILLFRSRHQGTIRLGKKNFRLPSTGILSGQILFSVLDIGFAGATLYILLPDHSFSFAGFLAVFAIALVAGVLSHVPGGIGVFEAVMATALHRFVPLEGLTAALVSYRAIYYLFPFIVGIVLLILSELFISFKQRWQTGYEGLETSVYLFGKVVHSSLPVALTGLTFISGCILLWGSSVPLTHKSLLLLEDVFPIEIIELSHILGGVVGIILIILSFALWQRIQAALWISSFLFMVGALLSFVQTLDYDRAIVMLLALILLFTGQKQFYRRARLFSTRLNFKWVLLTAAALASFIWLLIFSFKATPYQNDLLWKLASDIQVPRGLRTAIIATSTFLIFYVLNMLRPPKQPVEVLDQTMLELAGDIIKKQDNADGNLALTGDKTLLFSESKRSFIMFSVHNRSWVSLGDPIGLSASEQIDLIWEFKSMANREQGHAVFYQISRDHLDWYIDAGFHLFKLGEEARIKLPDFTLEGSVSKHRKKLRYTHSKSVRDGLSFRIVYPPYSSDLLNELEHISDQWLGLKNVREKSFSLGRFSKEYINRFPLALVFDNQQLTAFANIFTTQTKKEATIDLMRHFPDANKNTMDFLFVELILAFKNKNYAEFTLGMAPLSGFLEHEHARLWDRLGLVIYKKGQHLYNFEGLKNFKNKFDPEWVPRYLATTKTGVSPFLTLADVAILVGGVKKK